MQTLEALEAITILDLSTVMGGVDDPRAGGMFDNNAGANRDYYQGNMKGSVQGPIGSRFEVEGSGQVGFARSDAAQCMENPKTTDPTKCLPQVQSLPVTKSP
jgi:hypothetical protein